MDEPVFRPFSYEIHEVTSREEVEELNKFIAIKEIIKIEKRNKRGV